MNKRSPDPYRDLRLPNEGSTWQTAASLLIDVHNERLRLKLVDRWNWDRYIRLCSFLRMTPFEIASLVLISHPDIPKYKVRNQLIDRRFHTSLLLLTLLEAKVCADYTTDVIENPFPDLNTIL